MSHFRVNRKCNGCLACVQNCPASALDYRDEAGKRTILHNMTMCARCGNCWRICPQKAVEFEHLLRGPWEEVVTMDLVRCVVCGEALYTPDFGDKLSQQLERDIEPLCPAHRRTQSLKIWSLFAPSAAQREEVPQ